MQAYKKKMKVIVDSNESIEYLERNSFVEIIFNEFTIRTGVIVDRLKELDKLAVDLPRILEETKHIEQLQEKVSLLTTENHNLKEQLQVKSKPTQKYESEIDILNKEKEVLTKLNTSLSSKVETLETNIQSLQDKNQDLKASLKNTGKLVQSEKDIKFICDRYSSYLSLRHLALVISIFCESQDTEYRLKEIITMEKLRKEMSVPTIQRHLYNARDLGILFCPRFKGTFRLKVSGYRDMGIDLDLVARYILGDHIYEISKQQFLKKLELQRY